MPRASGIAGTGVLGTMVHDRRCRAPMSAVGPFDRRHCDGSSRHPADETRRRVPGASVLLPGPTPRCLTAATPATRPTASRTPSSHHQTRSSLTGRRSVQSRSRSTNSMVASGYRSGPCRSEGRRSVRARGTKGSAGLWRGPLSMLHMRGHRSVDPGINECRVDRRRRSPEHHDGQSTRRPDGRVARS